MFNKNEKLISLSVYLITCYFNLWLFITIYIFSQSPMQYQHWINMLMLIYVQCIAIVFGASVFQFNFHFSLFLSLFNLFLLHFFLLFCQKTILFIKWFLAHLEWFFSLFKSHVYYIVIRFADAYADGINKMCYSQIRKTLNSRIHFYYYDYFSNILITKTKQNKQTIKIF